MAIEIKGLNSLMNKLASLGGNCLEALEQATQKVTLVAEGDAKANAAVDTGAMRQSISHKFDGREDGFTGTVYTNIEHALYNEMGTSKMAAQPFMKPAADASQGTYRKLSESELKQAIRRLGG